jgi:hypothetical protein
MEQRSIEAIRRNAVQTSQPGVVLKMRAKPGMGDALFELTTSLHYTDDPDLLVDWFLCRADDDPDVCGLLSSTGCFAWWAQLGSNQ